MSPAVDRRGRAVLVLSTAVLLATGWWALGDSLGLVADFALENDVEPLTHPFDYLLHLPVMAVVQGALLVLAWVATCRWLDPIQAEAHRRDPGVRRRPVWLWVCWLVPVVFFWAPRDVVHDTVGALTAADPAAAGGAAPDRPPIGQWWMWWGTYGTLDLLAFLPDGWVPVPEAVVLWAATATFAVCLVHWARVIARTTAWYELSRQPQPTP